MTPLVLVVEDDADLREVLAELLGALGYRAAQAADGLAAIARLDGGPPSDVILLDLLMPRMDGRAFLAWLRVHPALGDVPVVLATGTPPPDVAKLDVQGLLQKPVEARVLARELERVLARASPGRRRGA